MKITGIRTQAFEHDMKRPIADANNPVGQRQFSALAIFIDSDEGITGISLGNPALESLYHRMTQDLLVGRDPRGVVGLWQRMVDFAFKGGNRGFITDVISTLDIALWDLKAKLNDEPLWKTLGASSRAVKAYASGIDMCLTNDDMRDFYVTQAQNGIAIGKLKVGLDREADLRRIGIMHDALATSGKQPVILIDSNEYWSAKQAIQHIRYFEKHYDIFWAEEPARRWDWAGLRKVSDNVGAGVATGENLDDASEFRPLIANGAADYLQIGQGTGGITGALRVAHMADTFDLPVSMMNCPANFMAHLAAVLPNHIWMEFIDAGRDRVFKHNITIEDGYIMLGDEPGLGLSFDQSELDACAVVERPPEDTPTPWGRRRGAGLHIVPPDEPNVIGEE